MRVIAKRTLREFWQTAEHQAAQGPLEAWYDIAINACWQTPADIKAQFRNASILKNNRVVFNIKGNDYRLVVSINYVAQIIFVKFVGTHSQYDQIEAETI